MVGRWMDVYDAKRHRREQTDSHTTDCSRNDNQMVEGLIEQRTCTKTSARARERVGEPDADGKNSCRHYARIRQLMSHAVAHRGNHRTRLIFSQVQPLQRIATPRAGYCCVD